MRKRLHAALLLPLLIVAFGCSEENPVAPGAELQAENDIPSLDASSAYGGGTYEVTIKNLSRNQPLSPPVVATHSRSIRMFRVGRAASPELEAIAEDGNPAPMFDALSAASEVTDVVNVGMPLTRRGTTVGDFADQVTFDIEAESGDRISIAGMLICTNDGFAGLNAKRLPKHGRRVYWLWGYDSGTEHNTEASVDIVDACGALGKVPLPEDGNENDAVDKDGKVRYHRGIKGKGDLTRADHGWYGPVAKVIIKKK